MNDNGKECSVAVITGTSRGLGRNLAEYFLNRQFKVGGCSRGVSTLSHESYHHTLLDVANEVQVRRWIRSLKKKWGRIDVLICNAGLVQSTLFLSTTPGDLMESFLKTNFSGVFFALREVSKVMMSQRSGRIITISSTMTALHEEGTSVYSATKSAVTEMTKVLAKELAPTGITCNVIAPAMLWTDSSQELAKGKDWKERMLKKQTIPKILEMEEIYHTVEFFVSPMSRSITGQIIYLSLID